MSLCVVQVSPTAAEKACAHFTVNDILDIIDVKFFDDVKFPDDDDDMEAEWQRYFD